MDAYGMEKPTTATTRPRRLGEPDGHYRFLTNDEFVAGVEEGRFLETTVYSGYYFGTEAQEIDSIVDRGKIAVIPVDICGALTLKNRYRSKALLVFTSKKRYDVIKDIVARDLPADDMTRRILSLDDEYRNEELCDVTVVTDVSADKAASDIAEAIGL
jgi:guanylate kinase